MGSLAAALDQDMFVENDLVSVISDPFVSDWQSSLFDNSGLVKDWGVPSSTTQGEHGLYIEPSCEFGDGFFSTGFQTTPISVLDYVQQQDFPPLQQQTQECFGNGYVDDGEIQEMLSGFTTCEQQQQQELEILQQVDRLAGELQGEIQGVSPISSSQGSSFSTSSTPMCPVIPKLEQRSPQFEPEPQEEHKQVARVHLNNYMTSDYRTQQFPQNSSLASSYHHGFHQQNHFPKFEPVDQQLRLVRMLLMCAGAVAEENLELAKVTLIQLRSMVPVAQGSPMERLASYIIDALFARLSHNTRSSMFQGLVCDKLQQLSSTTRSDMLEAFGVFYQHIPIGKFTHLTMNQILLEASERERMIHVIDFQVNLFLPALEVNINGLSIQVWYGAQWPSFLQSLAMRLGGPPMVRMTAVGSSLRDLQETGTKLLECARSLNVPFEYCILNVDLELFHAGMIELRDGEAVLINSLCQFHCFLKGDPTFLDQFLHDLRSLRPKLVVMAENDADHNSPIFINRFMSCLQYYSAVFDAFDTSLHLPSTLEGRNKLEELIIAQKLRNMIACEGNDRVERHESMRVWNSRMESAGFRAISMSHKAISQANMLLKMYFTNGYTMSTQDGFLILGWRGMPLNGVGAWI